MNATRRAGAALLAVTSLGLAGCGSADAPAGPSGTTPATSRPTVQPSSLVATGSGSQEDQMRIEITVGNQRFQATLDDSPASRDLGAQLPVTLEMSDHASVEKTGPLPSPLSLDGQPDGADPDMGDVGYYAPGNDLVLYYGDMTYYPGIVVLGRLDGDAAERIANLDGSITATVTTLD